MITQTKYNVIIKRDNLNVRNGASYNNAIVRVAQPGTYECKELKDGWAKIGRNEWVCTEFVTLEEIKPEVKEIKGSKKEITLDE